MLPRFAKHQAQAQGPWAYDLLRLQSALEPMLAELARRPQLGSELIEKSATAQVTGVALTVGVENLVEHGLGKVVRGWQLVDIRGPAFVWRVESPASSDYDETKHLALACSANVTVMLEVYA